LQAPVEKFVPTEAPVSLPGVGGFASARSEGFTFQEIVSCSAANTHVTSADHAADGSATLLVTSVVEGLNILEVFSAERIVVQMNINVSGATGQISVTPLGSTFEGVKVAGFPCQIKLAEGLQHLDRTPEGRSRSLTWSDVRHIGRAQAKALLSSVKSHREDDVYQWAERKYGWVIPEPTGPGTAMCSIVESIETEAPVHVHGHIIEIPHFGRISLGELAVSPKRAQLTGVRGDLGCVNTGAITACCGGGGSTGDD
jgi:hypothetical protein